MKKHILYTILLIGYLSSSYVAEPTGMVLKPYLQFGTQTSMTILWETRGETDAIVRYGEARLGDQEPNLEQEIRLEEEATIHELVLKNLKPQTTYFYQVVSGGRKSKVYSFQTAVKKDTPYAFAIIGDTQRDLRDPHAWARIAKLAWAERPNFAVHAGDLVSRGNIKRNWTNHFLKPGQELMCHVPMYTVLGNHERNDPFYYQYMANPEPEYYYSFTYGNAEFFMLDSNKELKPESEQYKWLEEKLANSTAMWKFVAHHHPPYSSDENDHGDTEKAASTLGNSNVRHLVPLYEQYKVDMVFFGHVHAYERTWPIINGKAQHNGVMYIQTGGGGGHLEDFAPSRSWFTNHVFRGHHYCMIAIFDNTLEFRAIDEEMRMFDIFRLEK